MLTLSQVGQLLGAGTIGGFVAGEITRRLSARQERRGHFGKAMADLLEVRYGLLAIEAIREDLIKLTGSADMIGPQLHIIANVFLPNWNELHSRYDLAVSAIAGFNPILAFRLRSKDIARPLFATLSQLAAQDQQAATVFSTLGQALGDQAKLSLETAILAVAWRHGFWTWVKAKKQIRIKVNVQQRRLSGTDVQLFRQFRQECFGGPGRKVCGSVRA